VLDLEKSEESSLIKDFGGQLKRKIDLLDGELHKMKGGLNSQVEYEQILNDRLFDLALSGDDRTFK